jgi:hypothetical protein
VRRLVLLLLASTGLLSAQEFRGSFSGAVTDAQGAGVPKAKVTATETQTGVKTAVEADASGAYTIPFLPLGEYEVRAEAPGFKVFTRKGLKLSANEHPVIDIRLDVGAISESVEVTADAPLLVTANPSVGQVITTAEVEDIPINGRTPMMLDNLALGVVSTFEPGPVRPFDNGAPNSVSIGGAPSARNEVLLNGAPNAGFSNQMAYSPMQDAVQEVRVNLFDMDASMGHSMGGTINLITKQGTNGLHGSANLFNQTSKLDANSFFNNRGAVPRPSYHQNQWGVNGGGPVVLPKIFNGKNRVFWYFGYEGMRDSDPATSPLETGNPENFTSVPTAKERQGDFSELLTVSQRDPSDKNNYTIYDPRTGVLQGTQVKRQPFPGNVIPQDRLNPIALKYLQFFPLPNAAGRGNFNQNFVTNAIDSDGYDNELGRFDFNVTDRYRMTFDARHNFRAQNKNDFFHNPATGNYLYRMNQGAGIDNVYTISPSVFANVRLGWTRYEEHHFSPADSIDPSELGFPSSLTNAAPWRMLPYVVFSSTSVSAGARSGFEPLGYNGDGTNYSDVFQLFGQVMKIKGNHTIKAGLDGRLNQWSAYTFGNPSGTFTFNGNWTNSPADSNTTVFGQDMASFLLGLPSSGSIDLNAQSTVRSRYVALYIHDDWRVKSNLTLNLGLRYDRDLPESERYNRVVNGFDPTAPNSISAAAASAYAASYAAGAYAAYPPLAARPQFNALGGLLFANGSNPNVYQTSAHNVSPRFGAAWTPAALHGRTVIRGGVGMLIDGIQMPTPNQPGFSQSTALTATNDSYLTPVATLSNPFPTGILQPTGATKGTSTFIGQGITLYNPNPLNPYSIRWEFSIQEQLPWSMVLEAAYIGNHGVHLAIDKNMDYVPRQYLSTSLVRDTPTINLLTGAVPNPMQGLIGTGSLNGKTVALQQLLLPFPQFTGFAVQKTNAGSSYYESLNLRLQKRYTNGLTLINNFVWNKLIDRLAYLNDSDLAPEKRLSGDSRPFRNVTAATYALPIGRGMAVNLQRRWVDALVGGWKLSGTLTLQSGPTLSWGNYIYYGGDLNLNPHTADGYAFDITRFERATSAQLASNIRYFDNQFDNLRRDVTRQLDISMDKNFKFGERRYFQLRVEAYNLPNRVGFGNPQTNPTNSAFGTIGSQANTPRRIQSGIKLVW